MSEPRVIYHRPRRAGKPTLQTMQRGVLLLLGVLVVVAVVLVIIATAGRAHGQELPPPSEVGEPPLPMPPMPLGACDAHGRMCTRIALPIVRIDRP